MTPHELICERCGRVSGPYNREESIDWTTRRCRGGCRSSSPDPYVVRAGWRRWFTWAEAEARRTQQPRNFYYPNGTWAGCSLGVTISPMRIRDATRWSRWRDKRWAARNGYRVDAEGVLWCDS